MTRCSDLSSIFPTLAWNQPLPLEALVSFNGKGVEVFIYHMGSQNQRAKQLSVEEDVTLLSE